MDFSRREFANVSGVVRRVEYDPNRSANIALLEFGDLDSQDGSQPPLPMAYILRPEGLQVGDRVVSGASAPVALGNCMELRHIPAGTRIHNIGAHCR